jgi:hypothetical protein
MTNQAVADFLGTRKIAVDRGIFFDKKDELAGI